MLNDILESQADSPQRFQIRRTISDSIASNNNALKAAGEIRGFLGKILAYITEKLTLKKKQTLSNQIRIYLSRTAIMRGLS